MIPTKFNRKTDFDRIPSVALCRPAMKHLSRGHPVKLPPLRLPTRQQHAVPLSHDASALRIGNDISAALQSEKPVLLSPVVMALSGSPVSSLRRCSHSTRRRCPNSFNPATYAVDEIEESAAQDLADLLTMLPCPEELLPTDDAPPMVALSIHLVREARRGRGG